MLLRSVGQEVGATHLSAADRRVGASQETGDSPGNRAKDTSGRQAFPQDKAFPLVDVMKASEASLYKDEGRTRDVPPW